MVEISVDCSSYERKEGGLPLRARERLLVFIPPQFPLETPSIESTHTRFADFAHVQWGKRLCLYQAPNTEWHPGDGMFGFFERLDYWLRHGALNQLDPTGLPLHPPAVYRKRSEIVVPRVNTPTPQPPWWAGYVEITRENNACVELGNWIAYNEVIPEKRLAGVILLPSTMPHEYPASVSRLQAVLAERNLAPNLLQLLLEMAALRNVDGKPLFIVLGAAMRGTAGDNKRLQHIAVWYIAPDRATNLREMVLQSDEGKKQIAADQFATWAKDAMVEWCYVREDRPEIVTPRDTGSPMAWWRGKRVTVLGCGALGTPIGMMIARAGAQTIKLYDDAAVAPGVLVRQNFDRSDIGYTKNSAARNKLKAINPDADIQDHHGDVIKAIATGTGELFNVDVVINATASNRVSAALERHFVDQSHERPPIVSVAIGHRADRALVTLAGRDFPGVSMDLDRRTKIELTNVLAGRPFLDEFWPAGDRDIKIFQPEPGCSDPTFIGSAADTFGLSAAMLNVASAWLAENDNCAHACALKALHVVHSQQFPSVLRYVWEPDHVLPDSRAGYQIRLSRAAEKELQGWIRSSERVRGREVETGGLLFGQIDEFLKIIWVSEVSGPPRDSVASRHGFICGTEGTAALNEEKRRRTRRSVSFVGMWHTHPDNLAVPSGTDQEAMQRVWTAAGSQARHFLMLIVGGRVPSHHIGGYLYAKSEFV